MKIYNVYVYHICSTNENDEGIHTCYNFVCSFKDKPCDTVLDAIWDQVKQIFIADSKGVVYVEKDRTLTFHCDNNFDVDDYELIIQEDETIEVEDDDDWVE